MARSEPEVAPSPSGDWRRWFGQVGGQQKAAACSRFDFGFEAKMQSDSCRVLAVWRSPIRARRSSGFCTGVVNIPPVGIVPLGAGRCGQLDLAGEMREWSLDLYASYASPVRTVPRRRQAITGYCAVVTTAIPRRPCCSRTASKKLLPTATPTSASAARERRDHDRPSRAGRGLLAADPADAVLAWAPQCSWRSDE